MTAQLAGVWWKLCAVVFVGLLASAVCVAQTDSPQAAEDWSDPALVAAASEEGRTLTLTDGAATEEDSGEASVRIFVSTCWPASDQTPLQWLVVDDPSYDGHFDYVDDANGNSSTDLVYRGAGGQWMADTYGVSGTVGSGRCGWFRYKANGPGRATYEILYEQSLGAWITLGQHTIILQGSYRYLYGPYKDIPSCSGLRHRIIMEQPGLTMHVDEVHIGYWYDQ